MAKLTINSEIINAVTEFLRESEPSEVEIKIRAGTLYIEVDIPDDVAENLNELSDNDSTESLNNGSL
jgi:hypothetical protein